MKTTTKPMKTKNTQKYLTNITIYYFSGTGNSFVIARELTKKMKGNCINIAESLNAKSIETHAEIVGIVFPVNYVFNGGIPVLIKEFVNKLKDFKNKYLFSICTYGMAAADTVQNLRELIASQGGKLSAGFTIKMPYNYASWSFSLIETKQDKKNKMFYNCEKKLLSIYEFVSKRKSGIFETDSKIMFFIMELLGIRYKLGKNHYQTKALIDKPNNLPFEKIIPLMDKSFKCDEQQCLSCGTCSKVCPVNNIKMVDGKPIWQHNCQQCFACLQWCPKAAIQFGDKTINQKRYHHPDVNAADLFVRN